MKYGKLNLGQIEAVVNKLGGMDGVYRLLRNELIIVENTEKWFERYGVIYFSLTSDGTTGEEWIARLGEKGIKLSHYAKTVLLSAHFRPAKPTIYDIAVLKGQNIDDSERVHEKIYADAKQANLTPVNAEIACLIREKFSDKELKSMGLKWIVAMHEAIEEPDGPKLLYVNGGLNEAALNAYYYKPNTSWHRETGFAFVTAKKSTA